MLVSIGFSPSTVSGPVRIAREASILFLFRENRPHKRRRKRRRPVLKFETLDRGAGRRDLARGDAGDVVDAGAAPVAVHGVEADEVLLRVARHLCPRSRDDEVARDAPPVSLADLVQPKQE